MARSADWALREAVREFAFGLPEAWEDHPWGESVAKVGKKVFVFFGVPETDTGLRLTVKLRDSHEEALAFDWVTPAGYGLDRGGWVSCVAPEDVPLEMITGWIEESYRIVAPKELVAQLDQRVVP
jgi:predicted DNA-binding protein (MmcQ/YjbR family)